MQIRTTNGQTYNVRRGDRVLTIGPRPHKFEDEDARFLQSRYVRRNYTEGIEQVADAPKRRVVEAEESGE